MTRYLIPVLLVLTTSTAFASALEVPLGARAAVKSKKAIAEIVVRDPSLLGVVVTDGALSLEGKKSGVTSVNVEYVDGELETRLVVVGEGQNAPGMSAEPSQKIDLKQSAKAQARRQRVDLVSAR